MDRKRFRYWSVIAALGLFALLALARYATLAAEGPESPRYPLGETRRGAIVDREGRLLAVDSNLYNIGAWRPELPPAERRAVAEGLAAILGGEVTSIESILNGEGSDFVYIRKKVPSSQAKAIQEAKARGSFHGIVVERGVGRLYPERNLASHALGFVGDDGKGLAGIENKYDDDLSPRPGPGGEGHPSMTEGNRVVLTLDADLQFEVDAIAARARVENRAEATIILVLDAPTGEILSYSADPGFDPNEFLLYPAAAWYDWPSAYAYEPGSVFKVFSMASLLQLGGIDEETILTCDGAYRRLAPSGEEIKIKCLGSHGEVDLRRILEYSCNAGAGYASDSVDPLDFYEALRAFGFGGRTGVPLAGESAGLLARPEDWSLRTKPTLATGQEILVSAVQMAQAATAVANGGLLMKPLLVKRIQTPDGALVFEQAPQPVRRVLSAGTATIILSAMEAASGETGTGKRAKLPDIRMSVKTGTAQMIDAATGRYSEEDFIASTMAIFPTEAPRYIVYVAIVKPMGESYYGGRIAAPFVREVADRVLELRGEARGAARMVEAPSSIALGTLLPAEIGETMPDLIGMPKRLLVPLLMRKDIKVRIQGSGYVTRQSPEPGAPVPAGTEVILVLE